MNTSRSLKFIEQDPNGKYLDLVIFTSYSYQSADKKLRKDFPILKDQIMIADDVWISEIDEKIAEEIIDACTAKGFNFNSKENYARLFRSLYAIGRESPPTEDNTNWDIDKKIRTCMALSRLVQPTSIDTQYSAKLKFDKNDHITQIIPERYGIGSDAYVTPDTRDWLTQKDGYELKQLYTHYQNKTLIEPFKKALWFFEYASTLYHLDIRTVLITAGLEALINTQKERISKQFKTRIQKLSEKCGTGEISSTMADDMYSLRSKIVHGQTITSSPDRNTRLSKQLEEILRIAIRKAILDDSFMNFFSDKDLIGNQWPIDNVTGHK